MNAQLLPFAAFSKLPTSHHLTSQRYTLPQTYIFQKNERTLHEKFENSYNFPFSCNECSVRNYTASHDSDGE